jgi:hypothetical protein
MFVARPVFQLVSGSLKVVMLSNTKEKSVTLLTHQFPIGHPYVSATGEVLDGFWTYATTADRSSVFV